MCAVRRLLTVLENKHRVILICVYVFWCRLLCMCVCWCVRVGVCALTDLGYGREIFLCRILRPLMFKSSTFVQINLEICELIYV